MFSQWLSEINESAEPAWFPWNAKSPRVVLSSQVTARRNVDGVLFPPFAGHADHAELACSTLLHAFDRHPECDVPQRIDPAELTSEQKTLFKFHNLAGMSFMSAPAHRMLLVSDDRHTCCRINESNHLVVQSYAPGLHLNACNDRVQGILAAVATETPFAWDEYFGYLCDKPELCGSGFTASVHLNLPAIILMGYADHLIRAAADMGLQLRLDKVEQDFNSHLALLTAQNLPNCSPRKICVRLEDFTRRVVQHELDARKKLCEEPTVCKLRDMVGRAKALVQGAYLVSDLELIRTMSIFWLAQELGFKVHSLRQRDFFAFFTKRLCLMRINAKRKLGEQDSLKEAARLAADVKNLFSHRRCGE